MSRPIVISFPHKGTAAEAKAQADEIVRRLFEQYATHLSEKSIAWNGSHADLVVAALGQRLKGELDIAGGAMTVTVHLPWALLPLRDRAEKFLRNHSSTLRLPPKGG